MKIPKSPDLLIVQHALPHYRVQLFDELKTQRPETILMSGSSTLDGAKSDENAGYLVDCVGSTIAFGPLAVFTGSILVRLRAQVLVMPLNARLLDQWLLLLARYFTRRRSYVWGHFSSRGKTEPTLLRKLMVRLSEGVIAYTETDGDRFRKSGVSKVFVAQNAAHDFPETLPAKAEDWRHGLLVLGRITEEKRIEVALDVLERLVAMAPAKPWTLNIVGAGSSAIEQRLGLQVSGHPFVDRINMVGEVTDPVELAKIASHCGVHLVPGYAGLNVVDAAALGLLTVLGASDEHAPEWLDLRHSSGLDVASSSSPEDLTETVLINVESMEELDLRSVAMSSREMYSPKRTAASVLRVVADG